MKMEESKVIYLDEQLPPINELVLLVIVEVNHGKSTGSKLSINYDWGRRFEDGTWFTDNDWDEGQPWAIVAWMPEPKLPSEEEIRKHKIEWHNERQPKINWISDWSEDQINDHIKRMENYNANRQKTEQRSKNND